MHSLDRYLQDTGKEHEKQEGAIFSIMKMIDIRGGCIPDYTSVGTQTDF